MSILIVGTMSGTSLDGIDIALCRFSESADIWSYEILDGLTVSYTSEWIEKLKGAPLLSGEKLLLLHNEYGRYTGKLIAEFLQGKEKPRLIASHGHTIFHQPENHFTFQLGNGASIAAATGITTICDFRNFDIALGGQGAPLVPAGDQLLFGEYDFCLNIGGIANISFEKGEKRIAYDICPANIILNALAIQKGLSFDMDGQLGVSGRADENLLKKINSLGYYNQPWPKSLGREWIDQELTPLLIASGLKVEDQAATVYEHITDQISNATAKGGKLLITGGGAHNKFLLNRLRSKTSCRMIIPDQRLIDYKEALIFAFLGLLAYDGETNVYSSATGSRRNHSGGIIYNI